MEFKDQLISFKTAKLAKEKGFDYCVNNYYWIDENSLDCGDGDCEFACLNHNKYDDLYSAPNQTELQKWLRENHNINVYCRICDRQWNIYYEDVPSGIDLTPPYVIIKDFVNYEEALETGLYEALKLI